MSNTKLALSVSPVILLLSFATYGQVQSRTGSVDPEWQAAQVADALRAAPAVVTHRARIYAWQEDGTRVLVRDGAGPYACVGSGSWSLRLGLPALPYPDPMCADQNAWAFFEAFWSEANPLNPTRPLPTAPGIAWMLGGMNIAGGQVSFSREGEGSIEAGSGGGDAVINMTPHIMILPLPADPQLAEIPAVYDAMTPPEQWIMAAGSTLAHVHVHFSEAMHAALMEIPPPNSGPK